MHVTVLVPAAVTVLHRCAACSEEELRILRGEAAVDESRLGSRTTASSNASSSDDDADFVDDRRAAGDAGRRPGPTGSRGLQQRQSFKQQQQQQQETAGKVRIKRRAVV